MGIARAIWFFIFLVIAIFMIIAMAYGGVATVFGYKLYLWLLALTNSKIIALLICGLTVAVVGIIFIVIVIKLTIWFFTR